MKLMKYRSLQVTPEADGYIFDYEGNTAKEIWEQVSNQGSKWFFYPIPFVVTNKWGQNFKHSKIIDAPYNLEFLKGRTVSNAMKFLKNNQSFISTLIN